MYLSFSLIGVQLLYNIVGFCYTAEVNQLSVCLYSSLSDLLPTLLPSHPSRSSRSTKLSSLRCTAIPTSYFFYTWQCIYVKPNLPVHPTLPLKKNEGKNVHYPEEVYLSCCIIMERGSCCHRWYGSMILLLWWGFSADLWSPHIFASWLQEIQVSENTENYPRPNNHFLNIYLTPLPICLVASNT